ncbi:MAG: tRNA (N6-isopentenyl adenosine(37)-C2)-methylthiotransferase MiaB [Deltaproteobacteria bacterium]|nr:tRNA (N6-isopentenyl adenosine(37)-C2)-methylthiotransferase MiaB [Deltaproteobacteria bacterium]
MTEATESAKVYIETYGCQMNQLDSSLVADRLRRAGYQMVTDPALASVVLINTCSVRDLAEHKVWSHLGRLGVQKKGDRPGLVIGVLGCMAEREGQNIAVRMPYVDLVCGPDRLDRLPVLIRDAMTSRKPQVAIAGHGARLHAADDRDTHADAEPAADIDLARSVAPQAATFQAYVRVTRGCDKFCTFCVVPFTRGQEVHRAPRQIVDEVKRLADSGILEVTLLGQTVNHYVHVDGDRRTTFADLLWQVHEAVPHLPRLRFVTSYPRDFDQPTLEVMAAAARICRYLHLPAQSGADAVLMRMNRGYTAAAYLELLQRARAALPDVCLAGDMIAGFPGETEADHQASLGLLDAAQYKNCFVFQYSPRGGTVAAKRFADDVPDDVKHRRNLELLARQTEINLRHNNARVGATLEVLVESRSKISGHSRGDIVRIGRDRSPCADDVRLIGRTRGDEIVAFDGPAAWVGSLRTVEAVGATALTILAKIEKGGPHGS